MIRQLKRHAELQQRPWLIESSSGLPAGAPVLVMHDAAFLMMNSSVISENEFESAIGGESVTINVTITHHVMQDAPTNH